MPNVKADFYAKYTLTIKHKGGSTNVSMFNYDMRGGTANRSLQLNLPTPREAEHFANFMSHAIKLAIAEYTKRKELGEI